MSAPRRFRLSRIVAIATTTALAMPWAIAGGTRPAFAHGIAGPYLLLGPRVTPADGAATRATAQTRGRELSASDPAAAGLHYDGAAAAWGDAILFLDAADAYIAAGEKTDDEEMFAAAIERCRIALDLLHFQTDPAADKTFRVLADQDIPDLIARANQTIERAQALRDRLNDADVSAAPGPVDDDKRAKTDGKGLIIAGSAFIALGVGITAVGAAGIGIGATNQKKAESAAVYGNSYDDVAVRGRRGNLLAAVGFGIGGAALVAGVVMLVVGSKRKHRSATEQTVAIAPTTNGFSVSGRF